MKVPTNRIKDSINYYNAKLIPVYGENESMQLIMMLIEHYFGFDRKYLALHPDTRISESEMLIIHFAVKELLANRPIQYVIGQSFFCERWFEVNENVLIPRPETEELVGHAAAFLKTQKSKHFLDIGTGSGCIAISLALEVEGAEATAIDISAEALELAGRNALKLNAKVNFQQLDILTSFDSLTEHLYDLIVSNPPYITHAEKSFVQKNVMDWEPHLALFVSDDDPLQFFRQIAHFSLMHLKREGMLLFEINERYGFELVALLSELGFHKVHIIKDIHSRNRFVSALKA
jgi:release factor glutamine methyltransferase